MRLPILLVLFSLFLCPFSFATVKWSLSTADAISGKGVLTEGKAIFASYNGKVYAVNTTNGIATWTYDSGGKIILEPVLASIGILAVANSEGKLSILSVSDGNVLFESGLGKPPLSLAAGGERVYLATEGNVSAYSLNGTLLWNSPFFPPIGQIGYAEGEIFFTSGSKLNALDAANGSVEWAADADDSFLSRPVRHLGAVYFGAIDGKLYSIDAAFGRVRWAYPTRGWVMSTPLVTSDAIYFGSNDGYFYSVSPSGTLRFRHFTSEGAWTKPEIYENAGRQVVVFGTNEGKVYGLDSQTGNERWAFSSYGKPTSTTRSGNAFIFGTSTGRIYSLVPSPICSFTKPSPLETVGNFPSEIEGKSSADTGISRVEVRANKGDWILAQGTENWNADVDFSPFDSGAVTVECRTRDNAGNLEEGEYSFLLLIKSDTAQLKEMYISSPSEVDPKKAFNISARDNEGKELRRVTFSIEGVNRTSDSPLEVTLGKSGIVPVSIHKPGYDPVSFTVNGRGGGEALFAAAAIILLLAIALLYFFVIRKRKK
ncbi:TPA: PQQ-binding-like beta-propeller repeat protein [Candidatus Micrarchaeota archaeon]|nr:PQQ-binding-like beta-propeller repeat protein [Candidatus Micrarchaeota archaeon]